MPLKNTSAVIEGIIVDKFTVVPALNVCGCFSTFSVVSDEVTCTVTYFKAVVTVGTVTILPPISNLKRASSTSLNDRLINGATSNENGIVTVAPTASIWS